MQLQWITLRRACITLLVLLVPLLMPLTTSATLSEDPRPGFPVQLSSAPFQFGDVVLANINDDPALEIIAGAEDGSLYVVDANGELLWSFNVSEPINSAAQQVPGTQPSSAVVPIDSTPAVADINGDGQVEIIVNAGPILPQAHGGIVALSNSGELLWTYVSQQPTGIVQGYVRGGVSSPAVGDINGDGNPEVVFGWFDQYVYALSGQGVPIAGWPQFALDTVWSSPALADMDGNGTLDVVIGVDAHHYRGDERHTEDGGELICFDGSGTILWRAAQDEIFQSSPAIADIDGDGLLEVVAGSGTYYNEQRGGTIGHYFTAWNHDGSQLWKVDMPDTVSASPVVADIQNDGRWEVFVSADNGTVYAFDGPTGAVLWAVEGLTFAGDPVMVDYNGDGVQDVIVIDGWNVSLLDGSSGARLTPLRSTLSHLSLSSPAVDDLDGDGVVDLVQASGTQVNAWSLPLAQIPGVTPQPDETPAVTPEPDETPAVTPEPDETPTTPNPGGFGVFLPLVQR